MRLEGSNQVSYSNALHAQYQRMQYELVKAADATKTGVSAEWMAAWSLKFAGKATGRGAERKYELAVSGTEKTIWVQVKGDHLVQVVSVKPKE